MTPLNRRRFLGMAGLTGLGLGLAACARPPSNSAPTAMAGMEGITPTPSGPTADQMDALHKQGVDTFVANVGKDPIFWRKPLEYKMDGDTKVFEVTCTEGTWNASPDQSVDAMMYNGLVPGPEIRVTEGDKVRVICNNKMTRQSTSIHWHGVLVPNKMDGVPYITQDPIKPGASHLTSTSHRWPGAMSSVSHFQGFGTGQPS
jgi:FtsP/CotA-like multicopper oxidase with cupredoxin domain